jgi:hypothetical protein
VPGTGLRMPLRRLANHVRAIPGRMGIRPYTVEAQVTSSAGAEFGEGIQTVITTVITEANGQPPKVRWLSNKEIALGGYEDGTVEVGPITPDFPGGGTLIATLHPNPTAVNSTVRFVLRGPDYPATGARFRLNNLKHDRFCHYILVLERAAD